MTAINPLSLRPNRGRVLASFALLAATFTAAADCTAQDKVVVRAGRAITLAGPDIENAVVMIENGVITQIGKADDIEIPWDAQVVDASDGVVMPTWVLAHTSGGMRGANENMANVPYLTVADGIDPSSTFFAEALRNGVGTLHVLPGNSTLLGGRGMIVRPAGRTVEDMAVQEGAMKLSLFGGRQSRMGQIRRMRRAFEDIEKARAELARKKKEWDEEKAAGAIDEDAEWEEKMDEKQQPVVDLLDRKFQGYLYVPGPAEVPEAMRLAATFDAVLVLAPSCHEALPMIEKHGQPVILDGSVEYKKRNEETDETDTLCAAKVFADASIPFAFSINTSTNSPQRYPWWQIATAMRHGVDRNTAMAALTTVPAKILGIDDQVGSLAKGKVANMQILTGDPLDATSWVQTVVLNGEVVYERKDDPKLRYLFGKDDAEGSDGEGNRE